MIANPGYLIVPLFLACSWLSSGKQFTEFVRTEIAKWAKVVKASGAKVE